MSRTWLLNYRPRRVRPLRRELRSVFHPHSNVIESSTAYTLQCIEIIQSPLMPQQRPPGSYSPAKLTIQAPPHPILHNPVQIHLILSIIEYVHTISLQNISQQRTPNQAPDTHCMPCPHFTSSCVFCNTPSTRAGAHSRSWELWLVSTVQS